MITEQCLECGTIGSHTHDCTIGFIEKKNYENSPDGIIALLQAQLAAEKEARVKAERELAEERELRIMQLAGISTASIQNTESSKKDRIERDNPYWSTAYGDTCAAVDREIRERIAKEASESRVKELEAEVERLRKRQIPQTLK